MSTIPDRAMWFLESEVKGQFVGYSIKRVSDHLECVSVKSKNLFRYKSFLGVKYFKEYVIFDKEIEFKYEFVGYYMGREFLIKCAVDDDTKKVYWKVRRTFAEMGGLY